MKTIIAGSRNITNPIWLERLLLFMRDPVAYPDPKTRPVITEVVCGEAHGVDTIGKEWALLNNIPVKSFPADWKTHGKKAGYLRNVQMAEYADALLAIMYIDKNGKGTPGTTNMINIAKEKNLKMWIQYVYPETFV